MTIFNSGHHNYFQAPIFNRPDNKPDEEKKTDRELNERTISRIDMRKDIGEEIEAFLSLLKKQRKTLSQQPRLSEQLHEQLAALKLRQSQALRESQLTFYQSSSVQARQEIRTATQRLEQLMAAQTELEQVETTINETGFILPASALVKKAMLREAAFEPVPVLPSVIQQPLPENTTPDNPLLRSAPAEAPEKETYATEPAGAKDDITSIGQDKMTPEEKFWHELSMLLATNPLIDWQKFQAKEGYTLEWILNNADYQNRWDCGWALGVIMDELKPLIDKFAAQLNQGFPIPEGLSDEALKNLLDNAGIGYSVKDGRVFLDIKVDTTALYNALDRFYKVLNQETNNDAAIKQWRQEVLNNLTGLSGAFITLNEKLTAFYPFPIIPEADDSSLSGWLQGMLPGFDSIDKSNINFYKSLIALITAWQSKINEFNAKYAEVLKGSNGVDQNDGKHRFDTKAVNEMLAVLDDINAMEYQMALILGGVTETDLANLLEGTGINYSEMVGTVALVDIGSDVVKMLKEAVSNCFSATQDKQYLVTPEQLAQFNSVLTQVQTQFDTVVKKVNTKTESAKSLFNDTREALSNLIKTYESLLADLAKMIR